MNLPVFKIKKSPNNSGQTLLLILLSMAVVLTIVLSILSRSVTDVAVTSREEESQRAFSAAEAGIEASLVGGILSGDLGNNAFYSADVSEYAKGLTEFVYPLGLVSGETGMIWFVGHDDEGNMTCSTGDCFTGSAIQVCWGTSEEETVVPAIEVTTFYTPTAGSYATTQIARVTADSDATRRVSNSFDAADGFTCDIDGTHFKYSKTVNFSALGIVGYATPNVLQFATVRMLYNTNAEKFGVIATGDTLPSQGLVASSTGTAGEATRRVEVFQGYSEAAPIFQSALFSLGGIVK